MKKLYELSVDWNTLLLFFILFVLFLVAEIIAIIIYNKPRSDYNLEFSEIPIVGNLFPKRSVRKEQAILAFIISIILFCIFLLKTGKENYCIYNKYNNSNYNIVSGEVTEFIAGGSDYSKVESFYIDNVKFEYSDSNYYGYNKTKNEGGVITGNGQKLKIGYINYNGENTIVSIEQME